MAHQLAALKILHNEAAHLISTRITMMAIRHTIVAIDRDKVNRIEITRRNIHLSTTGSIPWCSRCVQAEPDAVAMLHAGAAREGRGVDEDEEEEEQGGCDTQGR